MSEKRHYAYAITDYLKERMDGKDEAARVLRRQYVPHGDERHTRSDESDDPTADEHHSPCAGIVHRYDDRVLLMPLLGCAVYCRFCFRRAVVGGGMLSAAQLREALSYIKDNTQIREVIISGGDPLILSVRRLRFLLEFLQGVKHVDVIRIHSRVPVADPARIDDKILAALDEVEKGLFLVIHANHASELRHEAVRAACHRLGRARVALLGQSVLLKGVNDSADALEDLWRAMVRLRIKPYYLHHLDRARGTSHFRVSMKKGRALVDELRGNLSGIAQATYVIETPRGSGKSPLAQSWVQEHGNGYIIRDYNGGTHFYGD